MMEGYRVKTKFLLEPKIMVDGWIIKNNSWKFL